MTDYKKNIDPPQCEKDGGGWVDRGTGGENGGCIWVPCKCWVCQANAREKSKILPPSV